MNKLFRLLPLQAKLMLIGLIPFCFLFYLVVKVYDERTEKLALFEDYRHYIDESEDIGKLITAMQDERKFSFDYILTGNMKAELLLQRPRTNDILKKLEQSKDPMLSGFVNYTKLRQLDSIRDKIDSLKIDANGVMHYYSNTVFRLNTLNTIPPASTPYLKPVYGELMAHKTLSEIITYLGIIRSNIYNVLQTKKYMVETLYGTYGTYDVYKSYEQELFVKAPAAILAKYQEAKQKTALQPTSLYIDKLFKTFTFDETFTAQEWWKVSEQGNNELLKLQNSTWKNLNSQIDRLYQDEKHERNKTLLLLVVALIAMFFIVSYMLYLIRRSLIKLRIAADKIANGEIGIGLTLETHDVIGRLSQAVSKIDNNNRILSEAAIEIGNGNFHVEVNPRSQADLLGNAVLSMKNALLQYNRKMENLVSQRTEELARSNEDLQQFAHVASHDLKEPLRKIATFSNILLEEHAANLSDKGKLYLAKIEGASQRMSVMIEGVLAYSTVATDEQTFEPISLNAVIEDVRNDLELAIIQRDVEIRYGELPKVSGIRILIYQLFFNLISNSIKFLRPGERPVITITAEKTKAAPNKKEGSFVCITLADNGIGFNPEYAEKIFGVFTRLNAKESYEGTGLGLALCRKIVERHGGKITAESIEGKGATFHILLPDPE